MKEKNNSLSDRLALTVEEVKSEEVQAIIDRMPTYWVKWVTLCVVVLMGMILLLSFVIEFPDTVDGEISITAQLAPVRLVANSSARIHLLKHNKIWLQKGDVIAYLENGADYIHILQLESILLKTRLKTKNILILPDTLILGEVSSPYNAYVLSLSQYNRLCTSDIYNNMQQNLQKQIEADEKIGTNYEKEISLKSQVLLNSNEQLTKDSILRSANGLSEKEYKQLFNDHLSLKEAKLNLQSSILQKKSDVNKNKLEFQRLKLQKQDEIYKAYSELITSRNELINAINVWKERYLQYSPIVGELEYLDFWRENTFVQSGQELFTVIPGKNNVLGEVMIPALGAGKVETGQTVNVKISKFPYDEYGLIQGRVKSISRLTNKIKTKDGTSDAYQVIIYFPKGLVTNFGLHLKLDFESRGTAEIITKRKRLIDRLFDNLKSRAVK
jgi:hypothetical protein